MAIRDWLSPPRHLVALFLLLTLVPSLLLIAFGWRLLGQDLELERQQADVSREQAADIIVAALEQTVSATEAAMAAVPQLEVLARPAGGATVIFTREGAEVFPPGRLLFHPVASPGVRDLVARRPVAGLLCVPGPSRESGRDARGARCGLRQRP